MRVAERVGHEGNAPLGIDAASPPLRGATEKSAAARPDDEASPFARILRGLGREMDRGETLVRGAIHGTAAGQDLGNGALLALQAGVYRYSEAVDLSAKLVDRAASGLKTVLQGQ